MSDQIRNGLTRYESWVDSGRERLVPLELDVTCGRLRYRDRLLWDANEPHNKADADEFAAGVCADLGLGCALLCSKPLCAWQLQHTLSAHSPAAPRARRSEFADAIAASLTAQKTAKRAAVMAEVLRGGRTETAPDPAVLEGPWGPTLEWVEPEQAAPA